MRDCEEIRRLNDAFRQTLKGGRLIATAAVANHPDLLLLVTRVQAYSEFDTDNDPYG
jgi:hypothetical protein